MSSFSKPNTEIGDRTYVVAVLIGLDGSYTLTAVQHPEAVQVYHSRAMGGPRPGEGTLSEPMARAAKFIEEDVLARGAGLEGRKP